MKRKNEKDYVQEIIAAGDDEEKILHIVCEIASQAWSEGYNEGLQEAENGYM